MALLRRLNQENGQTFVIVTHDPRIGAMCDRIVQMRDGRIIDDGLAGSELDSRGGSGQ
ncbi:Macrolide export ATP-binding/permease protein MacB [bacterium HR27]|nr:Macrolide export ATP-binding/permease protein MacB [bacterium HR27]